MARLQFLALHRPGRSPSQRYRIEQFLKPLAEAGFEITYTWLLDADDDRDFYSGGVVSKAGIVFKSLWKLLREVPSPRADIVFVQREAIMLGTTVFERLITRNAKMVYDFDDSIWMLDVSEGNRRFAFLKNPAKTSKLIGMADLVLAGNEYLADYAKGFNKNVEVVPTVVDTQHYKPSDSVREPGQPVNIGWSGSATTVKHFVDIIPALHTLKDQYGDRIRFSLMGDADFRHEELGIQGKAWSEQDEISELQSFDIGLMPIPDDDWSQGKCGLKGLVYMSTGIPAILSPVGVNTKIVQHGSNGLLASSIDDWQQQMARLVEDEVLRNRLAREGRQTVKDHYSVLAWQDRLIELLQSLLK